MSVYFTIAEPLDSNASHKLLVLIGSDLAGKSRSEKREQRFSPIAGYLETGPISAVCALGYRTCEAPRSGCNRVYITSGNDIR